MKEAKIKLTALFKDYEKGGIKGGSMKCFWIKRLFEDDFRGWKVIPLFLIGKRLVRITSFMIILIFFQNLRFLIKVFSWNGSIIKLQDQLFHSWSCLSPFGLTTVLRLTVSLCIFLFFLTKVWTLLINCLIIIETKPWKDLKIDFHFKDIHKIYWLQIIDALP